MLTARRIAAALLAALCAVPPAAAQRIYKSVDEKGNVVYSQTPPAGKDAQKVDVPTTMRSTGTNVGPDHDAQVRRRAAAEERRTEHQRRMEEQRAQVEEQRKARLAQLEAECVRNRGTDCRDPETLRRMEHERSAPVRKR